MFKHTKTFLLYTGLLISSAFIIAPEKQKEISACAGFDPDAIINYRFFEPISFAEMSEFVWKKDSTTTANLADWKEYLGKVEDNDLKKIIYDVSADDMQKIRGFVTDGKMLDNKLKNNDVVKIWQKNKDLEAIDYLFYAKTCETQSYRYDPWMEDKPARDTEKMKWLADAGKKYYHEKASNPFLKVRFAYQAIRMAHYTNQYDKVIRFYDEMVTPIENQTNSPIKYWALAHKAGALYSNNKRGDAAYLFSRVFDVCPSKQASSFLSIKIYNINDWNNALKKCKNNDEKATLYFLRSLMNNANGIEEMQNVFEIAPNSDKLPYMLAREINKLEHDLLDIELDKNLLFAKNYKGDDQATARKNMETLRKLIMKAAADNKTNRVDVFKLAGGYLDYISGQTSKAKSTYNEVANKTKDEKIKKQVEVFQLALQISELQSIDDTQENEIYEKVKATKHKHLIDFTQNAFSRLYEKQGNKGKSFILRSDMYGLMTIANVEQVNDLLTMVNKKKMTILEKEIIAEKLNGKNAEATLNEMKATFLFAEDKLEEAIKVYQTIPNNQIKTIKNDPFQFTFKDCYENCPNTNGTGKYNRLTLAQKILNLKKLAEKNNLEQAEYLLQLGTAYYNISHFGNSWEALDYYRSGTDLATAQEIKQSKKNKYTHNVYFDMAKAKYYFDRCVTAAIKTGNDELAAKALYLGAKCEQNNYYLETKTEGWSFIAPTFEEKYRQNFRKIKNEFSKTKMFTDIKENCAYFKTMF